MQFEEMTEDDEFARQDGGRGEEENVVGGCSDCAYGHVSV